jgi:mRNA interferase MazF
LAQTTTSSSPSSPAAIFPANHPDFRATGLRVHSVLRLHRLITLSTSIIQRELGRLSPALEREASDKLSLLFAFRK